MAKQVTLEELLDLVTVQRTCTGKWQIRDVKGIILGDVCSNVLGNVYGFVYGNVGGTVGGDVGGTVGGDNGWHDRQVTDEELAQGASSTTQDTLY